MTTAKAIRANVLASGLIGKFSKGLGAGISGKEFPQLVQMTLDEFRQSLMATEPPAGLSLALLGFWWDGKGDWQRAHESAQQDEGVEGSWVHADLHRKEGDQSNAAYWYSRAGKPVCRERSMRNGIASLRLCLARLLAKAMDQ
jgi:hypothetical protein